MNRYQKILTILDAAVGGPTAPAGPHGAFWRGLSRDQFVALEVFALPLVTLGAGADSILVKALRGELPFGADSGLADIPAGGYQQADVPPEVWAKIQEFDHSYSEMLRLLAAAWTEGKPPRLVAAIGEMTKMTRIGRELIATPRPDNTGYGPCFRLVP